MNCPGVTAEVYPGATHLSFTACTSDAHTHARGISTAHDCGAGSSFDQQKETGVGNGQLGVCLALRSSASCCYHLVPSPLFGNPVPYPLFGNHYPRRGRVPRIPVLSPTSSLGYQP
jgi:hypothetical protein